MRLWIVLLAVLAVLAVTACRKRPTAECSKRCEKSEENCNNEGHPSMARGWQCSKIYDECLKACPTK